MKRFFFTLILFSFFISFSQENETNYKFPYFEIPPIYKGCENFKSITKQRKCFDSSIQQHIAKNFNSEVAYSKSKKKEKNCLGLESGKIKIYAKFNINENGEIEDINIKAPHPKLEKEAFRVIKLVPKMTPGTSNGKAVNVSYTVPMYVILK